jgi:energy-converting hydrogenase B subunit D
VTGFWILDYLCLAVVLACAAMVVLLPNLTGAVMALSGVGTVLSVLFVVLGAPDVAHAEVVVGAIALPVLYLIALGKLRTEVPDEGELGEEPEDERDGQT